MAFAALRASVFSYVWRVIATEGAGACFERQRQLAWSPFPFHMVVGFGFGSGPAQQWQSRRVGSSQPTGERMVRPGNGQELKSLPLLSMNRLLSVNLEKPCRRATLRHA